MSAESQRSNICVSLKSVKMCYQFYLPSGLLSHISSLSVASRYAVRTTDAPSGGANGTSRSTIRRKLCCSAWAHQSINGGQPQTSRPLTATHSTTAATTTTAASGTEQEQEVSVISYTIQLKTLSL